MIQPGKIVIGIDKKIYFEYCILDEPSFTDFEAKYGEGYTTITYFQKALKEYEAYKQLIEIINENDISKRGVRWILTSTWVTFIDNQKCKAEITRNTCIIIELIK